MKLRRETGADDAAPVFWNRRATLELLRKEATELVASDPTIPERLKDPNFFFLVNLKAHYTYLRLKDDGSYFTPAAEVSEQADSFVSASLFAYP